MQLRPVYERSEGGFPILETNMPLGLWTERLRQHAANARAYLEADPLWPDKMPDLRSGHPFAFHPLIHEVIDRFPGQPAVAILEAFKAVALRVKELTGGTTRARDGTPLMAEAFKETHPLLQINDGAADGERDEREGFKVIFMGAQLGVRNPKAHDPLMDIDENRALEYLAFASLLMRRLDDAVARIGVDG